MSRPQSDARAEADWELPRPDDVTGSASSELSEESSSVHSDVASSGEDSWQHDIERLERRGLAALERGDFSSAAKLFYSALELCETHNDQARALSVAAYGGLALYEQGMEERAVSVWEELISRGWHAPTIAGLLIEHYEERERHEDAERVRKLFSESSVPDMETAAEAEEPTASADEPHAARILIADDDDHFRDFLRRFLEREGYAVDVADNGEVALQKIFRWRPDVVLLDVYMPHYSGLDVLYRIREEGLDTAAIIISGMADASLVEGVPSLRAAFVRKPLDVEELRRNLHKLLETREGRSR